MITLKHLFFDDTTRVPNVPTIAKPVAVVVVSVQRFWQATAGAVVVVWWRATDIVPSAHAKESPIVARFEG